MSLSLTTRLGGVFAEALLGGKDQDYRRCGNHYLIISEKNLGK